MAVKSVLDVEVNDESFKNFASLFDKYQAQLAKTPAAWRAVGKENQQVYDGFQRMTAALLAQSELTRRQAANQNAIAEASRQTAGHWSNLVRTTKSVAGNIAEATTALLKWTGITAALGGLLGAGGIYGIDRIAASAAQGRRSSQGLGLSYGEQQAFGVTYGRVLDPRSFLGGISVATGNLASPQAAALYALGVNPTQQADTAQIGIQALTRVYGLAREMPTNQLGLLLQSRQLGELGLSLSDLRRLKDLTPAEFAKYRQQYGARVGQFGVGDPTLKAWQDLNVQLMAAGQNIKSVFIQGLVPLAPDIKSLSKSFADLVKSLVGSQGFKDAIDYIAKGLEEFAKYVRKPEFRQSVVDFVTDIGILAQKIVGALQWLGIIPDNVKPSSVPGFGKPSPSGTVQVIHGSRNPFTGEWNIAQPRYNPGDIKTPGGAAFQSYSSPQAGVRALAQQLRLDEYTHGQNTLRKIIYGNAQWPGYTTTDRAAYLKNVANWTGIGPNEPLNLMSADQLSKVVSAFTRQEGHTSYSPSAVVTILNNTGGSAIVQTAQMGFPQ